MAVLDDEGRRCLDRVPLFVQTVNADFIQQNEESLFSDESLDYTNYPTVDAAMVLGFDGIFGDIPSCYTYEPTEIIDAQGKKHIVNTEGREYYPDTRYYKNGLLTSQEILDTIWATLKPIKDSRAMRQVIEYQETIAPRMFMVPKTGGIFSRVILAMGYKEFAINYKKNTRFYRELIRFRAEILKIEIEGLIAGGGSKAGAVFIADDIAYKGRPMIPPERFESDYGPHYKEILGMASDAGIVPLIHTDGDATSMIPSFQDVGFRGLQGWEGGCDPANINDHFPDFIVIGFGDMNEVLPFGTQDSIEAHVGALMDSLKDNRHFMIGPSSVVNATMPLQNVKCFVDAAKKMGVY